MPELLKNSVDKLDAYDKIGAWLREEAQRKGFEEHHEVYLLTVDWQGGMIRHCKISDREDVHWSEHRRT